jgi:hypothetical protein
MSCPLEAHKGKQINIVMIGSNSAHPCKLIKVEPDWFCVSDQWSNKHYYDREKLISFWCEEDKSEKT